MDTLIPWTVWGRYEDENTVGYDDHQGAHVDFASIVYEYDRRKRTLEVQAVLDDEPDRVMIKTIEKMPGGKVWNFTKPPSNPPVWSFSRKQILPPQQCDMGSSRVVVDKYFGFRASFAAALKQ